MKFVAQRMHILLCNIFHILMVLSLPYSKNIKGKRNALLGLVNTDSAAIPSALGPAVIWMLIFTQEAELFNSVLLLFH